MIEAIIKMILEFIFYIVSFYTGEIILFLITFGMKKPRWDYYTKEKPSRFVVFTEISEWIGIAFWIMVVIILIQIL